MSGPRIFFGAEADAVHRRLFCRLYDVSAPCLPFARIMHWSSVARALRLESLPINAEKVFVAAGYFYGIHARPPSCAELAEAERQAVEQGADWTMVPLLRRADDDGLWEDRGYVRVPWFLESEYEVERGVDADLGAQLGQNTARNIRRLARRAAEEFELSCRCPDGDPGVLREFDALHQENLRKYGHARNTHGLAQLEILQESRLREHLLVAVHRHKSTRFAVQSSLNLHSAADRYFMMLVQGIRRDLVAPRHNLYQAETYRLYQWGRERGVGTFNLGRGGAASKAMLGCNRFHRLDIRLKPVLPRDARAELETLIRAATGWLERQEAEIRARLTRGKFQIQ